METDLTEYQKEKFHHLDHMKINQWYEISDKRADKEELIECLKLYKKVWGTVELTTDNKNFRKVYHPASVEWCIKHGIEL